MNIKIDLSRQGNFILAVLLIYFLFFGYICEMFGADVGIRLVFLNLILFNQDTYLSVFILMGIIFLMVYREDFFQFGLRNSIWITPIIIFLSWIWYWIAYGFTIEVIGIYFTNINGYITIFSLFGINIDTALIASYLKALNLKRKQELNKIQDFYNKKE